jgi:hypothetical protein
MKHHFPFVQLMLLMEVLHDRIDDEEEILNNEEEGPDRRGTASVIITHLRDTRTTLSGMVPPSGVYLQFGRVFETLVFENLDESNEFMEINHYNGSYHWGVLGVYEDRIHLAKLEDRGFPWRISKESGTTSSRSC